MVSSFSSRWGLPEASQNENFHKYVNRLLVTIGDNVNTSSADLKTFAYISGRSAGEFAGYNQFGGNSWFQARKYFSGVDAPVTYAHRLEDFLNSPIVTQRTKGQIVDLTNSSHIGIRVAFKEEHYFTYPEGDPRLDEEVVEKALAALGGGAAQEYAKSLKEYSERNWEQSAEKTRRSLEEYLRQYLGNKTALQANIPKLGAYLKNDANIADHLRTSMINQLMNLDTQYNDSSKHWSKTDGYIEAEYLIYQTGIMINTLEQIKLRTDEGKQ